MVGSAEKVPRSGKGLLKRLRKSWRGGPKVSIASAGLSIVSRDGDG